MRRHHPPVSAAPPQTDPPPQRAKRSYTCRPPAETLAYLTISEATEICRSLGLPFGRDRISRAVGDGSLPAYMLAGKKNTWGGHLLFVIRREDLDCWIAHTVLEPYRPGKKGGAK